MVNIVMLLLAKNLNNFTGFMKYLWILKMIQIKNFILEVANTNKKIMIYKKYIKKKMMKWWKN